MAIWQSDIEVYSYEILWRASESALRMAEVDDDRIRADHLAIHALLSGFLAFEGFINFVGEEIAPEVWKKEREFFSKNPFRGIAGKIDYLYSRFQPGKLDKGSEPYQTFNKIKKIRDALSHNRVSRYSVTASKAVRDFEPFWSDFDTPGKIAPSLLRLQEFAEEIRQEALNVFVGDIRSSHLHFYAFKGTIAYSEGREA